MEKATDIMEVLTKVDLDLAYCSEKLVNLHNLLIQISTWQNDLKSGVEYDDISPDFVEKSMKFDLLNTILKTEVKELDVFISTLEAVVVDARHQITCAQLKELSTVAQNKLHDTEESLRQTRDLILEMMMQLVKLQMTSLAFNQNEWSSNISVDVSENFQVLATYLNVQLQSVEELQILRMLEKSLATELDLEKKLAELKQNKEDIKLKLRLTEEVAQHMEEGAEVIWGRFLEAENAAEILLGISKEMVSRLQFAKLNLDNSIQRENILNAKLQYCIAESNAKENFKEDVNSISAQLLAKNAEAAFLTERVKLLEEQLRESLSQLKVAKASNEASLAQLAEMESMIESMRETIDDAEGRADSAEAKVTELTESNSELTEELNFLKGGNDSNNKKVSLLEKQLRGLEHQLQHARASSEANQEQQNMLYTAIWDMETLIDELKQKASKAETKTENAEEQCVVLSESNLELNKEVEFLRNRIESLETTLDQVTVEKMASAKDINIKTKVIMDMVMQLALERERVNQLLQALAKENKLLKGKAIRATKDDPLTLHDETGQDNDKPSAVIAELTDTSLHAASHDKATEPSSNARLKETNDIASLAQNGIDSSIASDNGSNLGPKAEFKKSVEAEQSRRLYILMAILMVLLSILAAYLYLRDDEDTQFFRLS